MKNPPTFFVQSHRRVEIVTKEIPDSKNFPFNPLLKKKKAFDHKERS